MIGRQTTLFARSRSAWEVLGTPCYCPNAGSETDQARPPPRRIVSHHTASPLGRILSKIAEVGGRPLRAEFVERQVANVRGTVDLELRQGCPHAFLVPREDAGVFSRRLSVVRSAMGFAKPL